MGGLSDLLQPKRSSYCLKSEHALPPLAIHLLFFGDFFSDGRLRIIGSPTGGGWTGIQTICSGFRVFRANFWIIRVRISTKLIPFCAIVTSFGSLCCLSIYILNTTWCKCAWAYYSTVIGFLSVAFYFGLF